MQKITVKIIVLIIEIRIILLVWSCWERMRLLFCVRGFLKLECQKIVKKVCLESLLLKHKHSFATIYRFLVDTYKQHEFDGTVHSIYHSKCTRINFTLCYSQNEQILPNTIEHKCHV